MIHRISVRKILAVFLSVAAGSLLVAIIVTGQKLPPPPALNIASIEPAGMFDERGEMSLLTLIISNRADLPLPENAVHVRNQKKASTVEARISNVWVEVQGALTCHIRPHESRDHFILFPAGVDCFRLSIQYTGSSLSFKKKPIKERLEWLAERLPGALRSRLPRGFWRWVGFGPDYVPNSNWRTLTVEIPLTPVVNSARSVY